jgi:hypothetical protein
MLFIIEKRQLAPANVPLPRGSNESYRNRLLKHWAAAPSNYSMR